MELMERIYRLFWFGWVLLLLAGCAPASTLMRTNDSDKNMSSLGREEKQPSSEEGSLWPSGVPQNLYADVKARRVGDVVTINIVESARASKNATTKTERESGVEASWNGIFDAIAGAWTINGQKVGTSHKIALGNNFDGKGETTRSSYMNAFITARVVHVLPNGNLVIRGTRQVKVNNENQYIFIQGLIRTEDISSTNIVLSTFVSDAVIEMGGQGAVSDKQRPGWLARVIDWTWPF
jgi:flagellar L-ring protein precursor FlgH